MNKKNDSKQVMLERKKRSVEKKLVGNMFIKYDENDSDGTPQQSN